MSFPTPTTTTTTTTSTSSKMNKNKKTPTTARNNNSNNIESTNKRSLEQQGVGDNYGGITVEESIAKKQKNYTPPDASRVVHLRNLPIECTEYDVQPIAAPFGMVEHLLVLKGKGQALIQMADLKSAESLVQYYTTTQGKIGSKNFYIQFSNRDEISPSIETPNDILLVTVSNIVYPITIEVLYRLFSNYGMVLKILIFSKAGSFQSLIQMESADVAFVTKKALDGFSVYGGCTLKVQFSSLTSLKIRYNNDKSRDFTNPNLLNQPPPPPPQLPPQQQQQQQPLIQISRPSSISIPLKQQQPPNIISPSLYMIPNFTPLLSTHQEQQQHQQQKKQQQQHHFDQNQQFHQQEQQINNFGNLTLNSNGNNNIIGSNSVLIVDGLPQTGVTPDDLFTLFGVYGDPVRIKIMFNRKDTALVQMNLPQQAAQVLKYLHSFPFRGQIVRVNISKNNSISLPKPGDDQSELTKDYTGSSMHRFKLPNSKNYQNIHPPSNILHVSNLPTSLNTEEIIKHAFSLYGEIKSFKFFQNDNKMALVELSSLEESLNSLVGLHGYAIGDNLIKVSFAKPMIHKKPLTSLVSLNLLHTNTNTTTTVSSPSLTSSNNKASN